MKKTKLKKKEKNYEFRVAIIFGFIALLGFITYEYYVQSNINKNFKISIGKVYTIFPNSRKANKSVRYEFKVNREKFTGDIIVSSFKKIQINEFYLVKYSSKNPNLNRLLIEEKLHQKIVFDSLKNNFDTLYQTKIIEKN